MPEPLKNLYNKTLITALGNQILKRYPTFDQRALTHSVFDNSWKDKELKQRMRHVVECLHIYLPADYKKAIAILKPVSLEFSGLEHMFFQDYVECYGLNDFETSVSSLAHFTKRSTAEFAVRVFILQDEKRMMQQMMTWASSDDHHLRRLASEGCRPRLPWAIALPAFKQDPKPVLKILKMLMTDESEYVRRSVANNLNDISKDNPETVIQWTERWLGKTKESDWILKHACRTLLKAGHQHTLTLFGFSEPGHLEVSDFNLQPEVALGEKLSFSFQISTNRKQSDKNRIGMCRMEYAIDFVKANGSTNRKVFKIAEADYDESEIIVTRYFSFRKISTRKYYTGRHRLVIIINGVEKSGGAFDLI